MPRACSGLLHERGMIAESISPTHQVGSPSAPRATTDPWWRPSTKPERTISATGTGASGVSTMSGSLGPRMTG